MFWGDKDVPRFLPGAATDNAALYTVISSTPVSSAERNSSLDFDDVFNDFVSSKGKKIQFY